ncbi:MAG: hypothetical protein RLZZ426_194 [Actinomycetota bacterium]|jgi:5'(3')-deoxyribonucleotidase
MTNNPTNKPIVYFDMDGTLVDFQSGIDRLSAIDQNHFDGRFDEHPDIFATMQPMPGAIEAVQQLKNHFEIYVLTTSPWKNPNAASHKILWIQRFFGDDKDSPFYKRVITSHHKRLNGGDYLIDDRKTAAEGFTGTHIHFGTAEFPRWSAVVEFLLKAHPPQD